MKVMVPFLVLWPLVHADPLQDADLVRKETRRMVGTWVITSASYCGEAAPGFVFGKDKVKWSFSGENYKAFIDGVKEAYEEGTYRLDVRRKHLDLLPTKGELLTTRRCLYSLSGDELKIGLSLWFAPGTPESEKKEGKKMRSTRPKSLDPKPKDSEDPRPEELTLILSLKRQKK